MFSTLFEVRYLKKRVILLGVFALVVWLLFFDSHSIYRRVQWHREHAMLAAENVRIEQQISEIEHKLEAAHSEEVIERIAREQYGMRRPGETIYRVEKK
jgi:cell division protein FtsB